MINVQGIKNEAQLKVVLIKQVAESFENISKKITDELMKNINERIYSKGASSIYYERTYQFFDAIIIPEVKITNGKVFVEVGVDYTKIKPMMGESHQFNKHMGFNSVDSWRGMTVGEALLSWWDYGTDNGRLSLPQTNYWYDVFGDREYASQPNYKKLDDLVNEIMSKHLGSLGKVVKK